MKKTSLSDLLTRMNRYAVLASIEEQSKVYDLDEALRNLKRKYQFPWAKKQSTLRVFDDILEYPTASDHDELAFLDDPKNPDDYSERPRFKFTSHQEFIENPDYRNDIAEIWNNGTKYLGVRYAIDNGTSVRLSDAETESDYTASGDATAVDYQTVYFKKGNGSIQVNITSSTGTATIVNTFTTQSDANYKKKYHFRLIYLDAAPPSIEMRLRNNASNYLSSGAITTQFSGKPFQADAWNLIGYDLNTATETGTFDSNSIASEAVILTGASTGIYYLDESHMRQWALMDYYYYSIYNIATVSASVPDQEYFLESGVYSTDSYLVGDEEFADVIMYDAMLNSVTDKENATLFSTWKQKRDDAWYDLMAQYPSDKPLIITQRYNFITDPTQDYENC